jgi:hypothetical protein
MSIALHRPDTLWTQNEPSPSVGLYLRSFRGEFDTDSIESEYPYQGLASKAFRRVTTIPRREGYGRFEGQGNGCWGIRMDSILNPLTADLLAAADALGGQTAFESSSALPGGIGADAGDVWVPLLDGGIGVEVVVWESESTNRVLARQRTTIRGPHAYRALAELLGFSWLNRRLPEEVAAPSHEEHIALMNTLLLASAGHQ